MRREGQCLCSGFWFPLARGAGACCPDAGAGRQLGRSLFAALYVPWRSRSSKRPRFELTYYRSGDPRDMTDAQRRRATGISIGAVVVSVPKQLDRRFFCAQPALLAGLPPWAEAIGAVLHGAPLAVVAYLVADLLLPQRPAAAHRATQAARPMPMPASATGAHSRRSRPHVRSSAFRHRMQIWRAWMPRRTSAPDAGRH